MSTSSPLLSFDNLHSDRRQTKTLLAADTAALQLWGVGKLSRCFASVTAVKRHLAMDTSAKTKTAISPRRDEDFPEWYQQVIRAAELAEPSEVRGCMVIRPWGHGTWENMHRQLDELMLATGHRYAAFPLFTPLSYAATEAA